MAPRPYLGFSHVGRPLNIVRLPWIGPERERVYSGFLEPAGPEGISFALTDVSDGLQVTASFHEGVFDRALIEAALNLVCQDPIRLLESL